MSICKFTPITLLFFACSFVGKAQSRSFDSPAMGSYTRATDLYDERGFEKSSSIALDGNLIVSEANGNVSYIYPISSQSIDGYPLNVNLTYNGSVGCTSYGLYNPAGKFEKTWWENTNFQSASWVVENDHWERLSQNRPAWILGVNGFAVQALSTSPFFHNNPLASMSQYPLASYDDRHCIWTINGYDVCNRMKVLNNTSDLGDADRIYLLQADGGVLELRNTTIMRDVRDGSEQPKDILNENLYTGSYYPVENNSSAYGKVFYDDTYWSDKLRTSIPSVLHPLTRPRVLHYYTGDGLEYVFREVIAPSGLASYLADSIRVEGNGTKYIVPLGHAFGGASIFYLEEINSGTRNLTKFTRSRHTSSNNPDNYSWDLSSGRALVTGFSGHTITYGENSITIEALGRTSTIKFRTVRSGFPAEFRLNEPETMELTQMPFARHGYSTAESESMAERAINLQRFFVIPVGRKDDFYQSYLGLVTEIIDPENRSITFDYEKYTRQYTNFHFPNSGLTPSTLTLNNWRLTTIKEPTAKYELSYYDGVNNYQTIDNIADGYWSGDSRTTNVLKKKKKYDKDGTTLLSTIDYEFELLDDLTGNYTYDWDQYDQTSFGPVNKDFTDYSNRVSVEFSNEPELAWKSHVQTTDNITSQLSSRTTFFHRYDIQQRRSNSGSSHFEPFYFGGPTASGARFKLIIPRKIVEEAGDVTLTTISNYTRVKQNIFLEGYRKVTVKQGLEPERLKELKTIEYIPTDAVRFTDGNTDFADRYGCDLASQTVTLYNPYDAEVYLKYMTEYEHLNYVGVPFLTERAINDTTWHRIASQQNTAALRRDGNEETENVFTVVDLNNLNTPEPYTPGIFLPPVYRLVKNTYTVDGQNTVLTGKEYDYLTSMDVNASYGQFRRGALTGETLIGEGGTDKLLIKNLIYTGGQYPTYRNLLQYSDNALGARQEFFYDYSLPELGNQYPVGKLLKNDGSIVNQKLYNDFRVFESPLAHKTYVRKWNSSGVLENVALTEYYERSYYNMPYSLVTGTIDANGWYSHFEYDWLGRLKKAWMPSDFPSASSGTGIETKNIRLYGQSEMTVWESTKTCSSNTNQINQISTIDKSRILLHPIIITGVQPRDCDDHPATSTLTYETRKMSRGNITYTAVSTDPIHQVSGSVKAYLRLFLTSAVGTDITINFSATQPSTNFNQEIATWKIDNRVSRFNSSMASNTSTKRRQRGIPHDEDQPFASCQGNYYLYIPLPADVVTKMQTMTNGETLDFISTITNIDYGTYRVEFANDADDVRPAIVVEGSFPNGPEFSNDDFTLAYRYDDCELTSDVFAKIDDINRTANPASSFPQPNPLNSQSSNSRFANLHYKLTTDYKVQSATKSGITTTYEYTGLNLPNQENEIAVGYSTLTAYDELGRPTEITHPDNTTLGMSYSTGLPSDFGLSDSDFFGFCSRTTTTDERGIQRNQYYDAFGRLRLEETDPSGENIIVQYEYDNIGRLLEVTNPADQQTTYTYDKFSRMRTKTQPDIGTVSYAYDKAGNVRFTQTQKQYEINKLSFYQYDDLNRPTVIGEATLQNTNSSPLPSNPSTRLTDWLEPNILHNGGQEDHMLTANFTMFISIILGGNPPVVADPLEITSCHPANYGTFIPKTSDALGEVLPVGMSFLKHPASAFPTLNTTYNIDTTNFENIAQNTQFVQTGIWYDALPPSQGGIWGHFPSAAEWNALAPTGTVQNLKGRQAAIAYRSHGSEPYHFTVYSYDERGRVEAMLRYTENLGFDAVYYKYNSMNQITEVTVADPMRQHTTWYATDQHGRINKVYASLSALNDGLDIPASYPTPLTRPSGSDLEYTYNNRGLVDYIDYWPILRVLSYQYNERKWPIQMELIDDNNAALFTQTLSYTDNNNVYDGRGQIWSQTWQDGTQTPETQTYMYDNLRRLTDWDQGGGLGENFLYDKVGNRTMWFKGGVTTLPTYGVGQNRLVRMDNPLTATQMTYDANGAMASREEIDNSTSTVLNLENFEYTTTGLLRQYHRSVNNGSSANTRHWYYRYSLGGAREQKRMSDDVFSGGVSSPAPDGEATWVYYALGVDRRQYAVHHAIKTHYTDCGYTSDPHVYFYPTEYMSYGAGDAATIVMKRDANDIWHKEYKVQDQLGSTRVTMDDNGNVTGQYNYEPFGAPMPGSGTEPRLSYIDREKDKESELGDFGVRKYDYEYGRFMSIDPLWEKYPDLSPYQYSLNQPIRYKDNNGKEVQLTGTLKEVEKLIRDIEYASGSILTYTSVKEKDDLYTLTLTGYKSVDSRFHKQQAYLDKLIKDDMIITVQYGNAGLHGGGSYDDKTQTVTIDRKLMNKNSTSFFYWNVSERRDFWGRYLGFNKNTVVNRDAWDTMAHELFGHAYDHITGALLTMDKEMAEIKAVWRENEVQELRGKLPRNAEQPSLWITPWD